MKRAFPLIALVAAACTAPLPAAPPPAGAAPPARAVPAPSPPSGVRLPRVARPSRYNVKLTVVPGRTELQGHIDIDLNFEEPTDVLWLNATDIAITDKPVLSSRGRRIFASVVPGNEDVIGFAFEDKAPGGPATLSMSFTGKISTRDDRGVFDEMYGGDHYVFTQFENIEARKAFPCFDEPSYKAPWNLELTVPRDAKALANTPQIQETPSGTDMKGTANADPRPMLKTVRFAETKPLPSYLVAFAVGPFEVVDAGKAGKKGTPMRVAVPRGKSASVRWAVESTPKVLGLLEDYFDAPYPYEKLDVVAIPQLVSFGAMENVGLITINASHVLAAGAEETASWKRSYVEYMAHEIAHQWFGDFVTLAFWDDIWLNESFAEWLGRKISGRFQPAWDEDVASVGATDFAMGGDTLTTSRKIRQEIATKDDIQNAFDAITYEKGGAVLSMFESWVGEERFQRGVRRYVAAHAHGNATADDFLSALSAEAGSEVGPAFRTFLDQPGVPLVRAELACDPGKPPRVKLSQERLLAVGSRGSPETWQIPICVRHGTADRHGSAEGRTCTLLEDSSAELELPAYARCPDWFVANAAAAGYYRVAYSKEALATLRKAGKRLTVAERVSVAGDVGALAQAGKVPAADALAFIAALADDPSPHVARTAAKIVARFRDPMLPEAVRPQFARFVARTFGKRARALGLVPRPGDDEQTQELRSLLIGLAAGRGDDKALVAEAKRLTARWLDDPAAIDPEAVDDVLRIAAGHSDRALFERLRAASKKTTERRRRDSIFSAMASFRDPALVHESLTMFVKDDLDPRDAFHLLFQDPRMTDAVFDFLKQNYDALLARLPGEVQGRLPGFARAYCDEARRAEVAAFFKDRIATLTGGPRNLAQTLERISLCNAVREAQKDSLSAFLKKY